MPQPNHISVFLVDDHQIMIDGIKALLADSDRYSVAGETTSSRQALEQLEKNLLELGSDKTRMLSAQVFMADIADKPVLDGVWNDWIGEDPAHWPQRAGAGVDLGGNWLIEVVVTACRVVDRTST